MSIIFEYVATNTMCYSSCFLHGILCVCRWLGGPAGSQVEKLNASDVAMPCKTSSLGKPRRPMVSRGVGSFLEGLRLVWGGGPFVSRLPDMSLLSRSAPFYG